MVVKKSDKKHVKNCPECGTEQAYGRYDHFLSALKGNWLCRNCGGKKNKGLGKYEEIPVAWFGVKERGGRDRGYTWDLTIEYIWQMYVDQNKKCAVSGKDIGWSKRGLSATASIDRIDNTEGYVKGNVQLVHKDVNFMKQQFDQDYFLDTCKQITEFQINQTKED